jgi:predicted nucleic acid-binding protein
VIRLSVRYWPEVSGITSLSSSLVSTGTGSSAHGIETTCRSSWIPENDIWIAALARQHHQPVVSRDGHFDDVPDLRRVAW